jgi:hypothetical protein
MVNGMTFNAQLTVKLSVFSNLRSLINQSSRVMRHAASRRCPLARLVAVREHPLLSCCGGLLPFIVDGGRNDRESRTANDGYAADGLPMKWTPGFTNASALRGYSDDLRQQEIQIRPELNLLSSGNTFFA